MVHPRHIVIATLLNIGIFQFGAHPKRIVGSLDGALTAADAGCDFVIMQGTEAGGHVRGTTPRQELLASVPARISIPVVAAGGGATARHFRPGKGQGSATSTCLVAVRLPGAVP
jgi:imidazole glycerol phosphate synthase subunit HisF